jgi:hypothetical protein
MTAPAAASAPSAPTLVPGAGRDGVIGNPHAWRYDPIRFQRGTRGFAAFWTALNGLAVLGLGAVVLPTSGLPDPAMAWAVGLAVSAGILHLVAVVGLIKARRWARDLVGYLAAAGIGAAAFGLLMVTRAQMPLGGPDLATTAAVFGWLIVTWSIAARFAFKAFSMPATRRPRLTVVPPVVAVPSAATVTAPVEAPARPRLVTVGAPG